MCGRTGNPVESLQPLNVVTGSSVGGRKQGPSQGQAQPRETAPRAAAASPRGAFLALERRCVLEEGSAGLFRWLQSGWLAPWTLSAPSPPGVSLILPRPDPQAST